MKITRSILPLSAAIAAIALGVATLPAEAAKPGSQLINITTPLGSEHDYDGVLDVCNGKFSATGTTGIYQEFVTGLVTGTTLVYTSTYLGDVNDGLGIWNPYAYSVDATRSGGDDWNGSYIVTKTNTVPPYETVTETGLIYGKVTYGGALVGANFRNHGQCIKSFASAK